MDASTRLYKRLGEIPSDPEDPESLNDLLVCAFGAFERYYVCWRTKGGEYRQDGHDLPPALHDWLYPTDSSTRDFATLQVVFGRGEEYFASDKNGKLEYKEPEIVKKAVEDEEKAMERQALRRSRTVSFLRPLSETSVRSDNSAAMEDRQSRRSESVSSQRPSRPPSMSYSRTNSEMSMYGQAQPGGLSRLSGSSMLSQWSAPGTDMTSADEMDLPPDAQKISTAGSDSKTAERLSSCSCGCHDPPLQTQQKPAYADSSTQTDPLPSPPRTALRIDTAASSFEPAYGSLTASQGAQTPILQPNPIFMGRMMDYFSKPGYQLGDSLSSGYNDYQPFTYQYTYQDEFGAEALR